jgi:hypothetical protein
VNYLVGGILIVIGVACFVAAPTFSMLLRRRDAAKADPRRNLEWSQGLDTGIFRFLGACVAIVGALLVTGIIPL